MAKTEDNSVMHKEAFEEACVQYGTDLTVWPADKREQAEHYVAAPEGAAVLEDAKKLDAFLAGARVATEPQAADAAFMARLARIPAEHPQSVGGFIGWLKDLLLPGFDGLGPRVIAQQVAVFAIVLGLGVAAGAGGLGVAGTTAEPEVDISDGWFSLTMDVEYSDDSLEG